MLFARVEIGMTKFSPKKPHFHPEMFQLLSRTSSFPRGPSRNFHLLAAEEPVTANLNFFAGRIASKLADK